MSDAPRGKSRRCLAEGCHLPIAANKVCCLEHFYVLPLELRTRITRLNRHEPGGLAHVRAISEVRQFLSLRNLTVTVER